MLETFKKFLADKEASDMYVTGAAGTGKTTDMAALVAMCVDLEIPYTVCAFTHKACDILRSKLPAGARVQTLHSYLCKRPSINTEALNHKHVSRSVKAGATDPDPYIVFVDEYSMVGEKDCTDIQAAMGLEDEPAIKVVWIGDSHQLPPVGDVQAICPGGPYNVKLTKQYRNSNPLQIPLQSLISYLEKRASPTPLEPVKGFFERGIDIVSGFKKCDQDKVILAYTNAKVQQLNEEIAGKTEPDIGDLVFSPTTQRTYTFVGWEESPTSIDRHFAEAMTLGTKYKTLEFLISSGNCRFANLVNELGEELTCAVVFGHNSYKLRKESLELEAVDANKSVASKASGLSAADWCRQNNTTTAAKKRAAAWRDCLGFKDCVICIDFTHATTVHKSQGSTYHTVFVDTQDIGMCADRDFTLYLKLLYVAISRASTKVYTN